MTATEPATQSKTDGPTEPKAIIFIGGAMNGKKVADLGKNELTLGCGIYRRVRMNCPKGDVFEVFAFFGWE